MTEKYPTLAPEQPSSYGPGFLLPNPGSPRIDEETPEYAEYLGVQLLPHEFMAKAVVAEAVSDRATEHGVTLSVQGEVITFEPPVSAELARDLGSLVNQQMHLLAQEAETAKHDLAMSA